MVFRPRSQPLVRPLAPEVFEAQLRRSGTTRRWVNCRTKRRSRASNASQEVPGTLDNPMQERRPASVGHRTLLKATDEGSLRPLQPKASISLQETDSHGEGLRLLGRVMPPRRVRLTPDQAPVARLAFAPGATWNQRRAGLAAPGPAS
jgi:hypothetical protein